MVVIHPESTQMRKSHIIVRSMDLVCLVWVVHLHNDIIVMTERAEA